MKATIVNYRNIVGDQLIAEIFKKARALYGKRIVHINSTYMGGGVAEILNSVVPLMNDIGIEAGWRILHGNPDFFTITKKFHNALQGAQINLSQMKKDLYARTNQNFAVYTHIDDLDCVIIHDPQPLPLIKFACKCQPWIWRCHVDMSEPNADLWEFLKTFLLRYDLAIFSSEKYLQKELPLDQKIIFPAIDPISLKNKALSENDIKKYIKRAQIPFDKPIITQVSRMDKWKDPEGLLKVFKQVKKKVDCRLVYCYNVATDDPESLQIFERVFQKAADFNEKGDVLFVMGNNEILVNAIQSASSVIVQKSTKEGFCLAVTEALWKSKPVVATNVGGIPLQVVDGETGFLTDPDDVEGFADRIVELLKDPDLSQRLGGNAKEYIRKRFLITRLLSNYLDVLNELVR
ncbi:MAG: glycosyltransferase [Candidatus Latescibacteria bacterium]|nr:glycosyltransferase [Candidatus Latescibacterota bacterium]NIM22277.1 glycosyltransferase [Candidatus Latescibacterota bacterium]NIM65756.1 glycosyltransferase [Candidatus Latescibacterota bacterium]NIO02141.1 glycosyltransferase [Candidatus Latescibacterota bacterium]NIO28973.1 glycosyltransferase [Candidatus Latescibacterota bacterium]